MLKFKDDEYVFAVGDMVYIRDFHLTPDGVRYARPPTVKTRGPFEVSRVAPVSESELYAAGHGQFVTLSGATIDFWSGAWLTPAP